MTATFLPPTFETQLATLATLLQQEEWRSADRLTAQLLLQSCDRPQAQGLTVDLVATLPCDRLHQIDQCWSQQSNGQFGFTAQRQIYDAIADGDSFAFAQQVGWVMHSWRPLGVYKFYSQLTFTTAAPPGHLPARWFWQMPWYQSLWRGGLGTGRGLAFGDADLLDALMVRLGRCQQV